MIIRGFIVLMALVVSATGQELTRQVRDMGAEREQRAAAAACRTNANYVTESALIAALEAANNAQQIKAVLVKMLKSRQAERAAEREARKATRRK